MSTKVALSIFRCEGHNQNGLLKPPGVCVPVFGGTISKISLIPKNIC